MSSPLTSGQRGRDKEREACAQLPHGEGHETSPNKCIALCNVRGDVSFTISAV